MSMTRQSAQYFDQVAGSWDSLRSGYFSEEVRQAAIERAYLRPEMAVADIGAGTGFLSAGLAPLVRKVYAVDGSQAMLDVARSKLAAVDNIEFHLAEGLSLPFPDDSLDAVFANMYLHHCPEPLAAIQEMVRILRPGGRLVLTDMDTHPYEWMKAEMADTWLGFARPQMLDWLAQAGLVNRMVDCTGQSCCAEAKTESLPDPQLRQAKISIFVAVGSKRVQGARQAVGEHYGAHAKASASSCCSPSASSSCCGDESGVNYVRGYSRDELSSVPGEAAAIGLGCGNPTAIASMQPGEVVVDIGSGGGLDAMLSANKVGPQGHVIGVDMTPEMLERARRAAKRSGYENVEFRQGQAEALPVENDSVDVVISNCVINLCEDKGQVFSEAYRVLRPGGRIEVSDMVTDRALPGDLREDPANWGDCVYGALPEAEYAALVRQAGFTDVKIQRSASAGLLHDVQVYSVYLSAKK